MTSLRLKSLEVLKLRGVKPCALAFDDGINFVLGRNASGKTTLLNLIASIFRQDFSMWRREPYHVRYRLEAVAGESTLSIEVEIEAKSNGALVQRHGDLPTRVQLSAKGEGAPWERSKTFARGSAEGESDSAANVAQAPWQRGFLQRLLLEDQGDFQRFRPYVYCLQAADGGRFDEGLGTFASMLGSFDASVGEGASSTLAAKLVIGIPFDAAEAVHALQMRGHFVPGVLEIDFGEELLELSSEERSRTRVRSSVSFLERVAELLGFERGVWEPILGESHRGAEGEVLRFDSFGFEFERRDGSFVRHDHLSFGQKRLLAFFYYLALECPVVIADELANGFHRDWIGAVLEEIGDRQAFLTSQNPVLVGEHTPETAEAIQRRFVVCSRDDTAEFSSMEWRNPTPEEARSLDRELSVGVEPLADVLYRWGLW